MKRECKIICPDNADALRAAKNAAIDVFGGVTITRGEGSWRDDTGTIIDEPVHVLTIATNDTIYTYENLEHIADEIGKIARQQCVYIAYPDGTVTMRDTAKLWA